MTTPIISPKSMALKGRATIATIAVMLAFGVGVGWVYRAMLGRGSSPFETLLDGGLAMFCMFGATVGSVQAVRLRPRKQHWLAVVAMLTAVGHTWRSGPTWSIAVAGALWLNVLVLSILGRRRLAVASILLCGGFVVGILANALRLGLPHRGDETHEPREEVRG